MEIPKDLKLEYGIYAALVKIADKTFKGALHFGPIPVFQDPNPSLEAFLIDMDEKNIPNLDLITLEPIKKLREVKNFKSSAELVRQIEQDVAQIKLVLT